MENKSKKEIDVKVKEHEDGAGVFVAGDYVLSKSVQYEIGNVQAGGIGVQIMNGCSATDTQADVVVRTEQTEDKPINRGILAVYQSGICDSADWAAVVELLKECQLIDATYSYSNCAKLINSICGRDNLTNADSISRSVFYSKVSGVYPNWKIIENKRTRETSNKLDKYKKIGQIFMDALKA